MTNQITYQYCSKCNTTGSLSSFLTNEGEIFHDCTACGSEEIIFHQELYQGTDNGDGLVSTGKETII